MLTNWERLVAALRPRFYYIFRMFGNSGDFVHYMIGKAKSANLPPITDEIVTLSATKISGKVRRREVTAEHVVRAFIDQVKACQPFINAIVDQRFDDAMKEAQEIDEFLRTTTLSEKELEEQKPFLGLPFTAKDSIMITGMIWTAGLHRRKHIRATKDALIVQRLRNAGAIPIALTNVPELMLWISSTNLMHGRTNNPYDTSRIAGGSSGGEAAVMTICGSPLSISTDMAGSIRMPAFYCGVYGHKPTQQVIESVGSWPPIDGELGELFTYGTMSRHAEDLPTTIRIMAGPQTVKLKDFDKPVDFKKLRVYYLDECNNDISTEPHPYVRKAIIDAAHYLRDKYNIKVERANDLDYLRDCSFWLSQHFVNMRDVPTLISEHTTRINPYKEVIKSLFGLSVYSTSTLTITTSQVAFESIIKRENVPNLYEKALKGVELAREKFVKWMGDDAIFIYVNMPRVALGHYSAILDLVNVCCPVLFNYMNCPATAIPCGMHNGLPYGIQVAAGPHNDRLNFAVAKELEELFGGWQNPRRCQFESTEKCN